MQANNSGMTLLHCWVLVQLLVVVVVVRAPGGHHLAAVCVDHTGA
jgi:hypothetical protein